MVVYSKIRFYTRSAEETVLVENYVATELDAYVRLRLPEHGSGIDCAPPLSIPGLLTRTKDEFPDVVALAHKVNGEWEKITYREYYEQVRSCAKAFLSHNLKRRESICILGFNSPEWFIANLAAIYVGGVSVGIYTTNSAEACYYCISHSNAKIVIVEDEKQAEKILEFRSKMADVKIVQIKGTPKAPSIMTWKQLLAASKLESDKRLDERLKTVSVNECCTIVYTSGTVGNPKGVMLSHDNLTWNASAILERIAIDRGNEVLVSYLPLSHIAAQIMDIYIPLLTGASVYFADKNALKGSLVDTLREVQPTKFLAVPRVWEKIYEKMMQVASQTGFFKRLIASWAKGYALQHHMDKMNGSNSKSWGYTIACSLVLKRIKQALGLNRCNFFVSAAAPISPEIKKYFFSLDIPIMDCFGMSEASGAHTLCTEEAYDLESIGKTLPGMKTKITDPEGDNEHGELCLYGRHIFMGYLKDPEKTAEALDEDGWMHTGDMGRIDERCFVHITGRLKELLITAGGENVPPVPIEQAIKTELPYISNAFLVGDRRKFLSVLLTLKTEVDAETGVPSDTLVREIQKLLQDIGCPAKTVTEVLEAGPDYRLLMVLKEGIDIVNEKATSNAQRVQRIAILPADFSIPTGELGPTMKVKRKIVEKKYAEIIDKIYN